nr:hypothetical protein [Tanacetum cinerariifolium]
MTGRTTRSSTANNTNPLNETADEVTRQLNIALLNLLTQLVQALRGNRANQKEATPSYSIKIFRAFGAKNFFDTKGMDWLSKLRAKIVCYEKIIQISLPNGSILEVHEERPEGNRKQLKTMKVNEPKLKDISVVCEFPDVFPEDLSSLSSSSEVELSSVESTRRRHSQNSIQNESKEEHEVHLKLILKLLEKEKLFGKFSKCKFWLQEVHFLGHVVNSEGIHVDPSKIEAV